MGCGPSNSKDPVAHTEAKKPEQQPHTEVNPVGAYQLNVAADEGDHDPNGAVESRPPVTLDNGIIYTGEWKGKKKHGKGRQDYPDGAYFDGEWENGLAEGKGTFCHADGTKYEGEWHHGKANGKGTLSQPNGYVVRYEGDWKDDLRHGYGKEERKDGTQYEGMYENGKIQGRGRVIWPKGNSYEGEMAHDELNGWGIYKWSNRLYAGHWQDNYMSGNGVFIWGDGKKYEGQYNKGKKEGYGTYDWPDGRQYRGWWKNNKHQGYGDFRSAKGEIRHAEYNAGSRVRFLEDNEVESFKRENDVPEVPELAKLPSWLYDLMKAAEGTLSSNMDEEE